MAADDVRAVVWHRDDGTLLETYTTVDEQDGQLAVVSYQDGPQGPPHCHRCHGCSCEHAQDVEAFRQTNRLRGW